MGVCQITRRNHFETRLTLLLTLFFQLNAFAQYEPLTISGSSIAFSSDGERAAALSSEEESVPPSLEDDIP